MTFPVGVYVGKLLAGSMVADPLEYIDTGGQLYVEDCAE